jgi:hypothetical protein
VIEALRVVAGNIRRFVGLNLNPDCHAGIGEEGQKRIENIRQILKTD